MSICRSSLVALLIAGAFGGGCVAADIDPGEQPAAEAEMPLRAHELTQSVNLLPNSSFERSVGTEAPEYWSRFGDYLPACPDWKIVERDAFDGTKCLLGAPGQTLSIPAETQGLPADEYVFSIHLKGSQPAARCELRLRARPDVDDGRSPWQSWDKTMQLTTSWKRYALPVKIDRRLEYNRWGIMGGLFACEVKPLDPGVLVDTAQLEQAASATEYVPSTVETRGQLPAWPSQDGLQTLCEGLQRTPPEALSPSEQGDVKVYVSRPAGANGGTYPACGGILFPRGALFDKDRVRLLGPRGEPVVLQTEALARYGLDASIRSLYVAFPADLSVGEEAPYTLEYNTASHPARGPLRVREGDDNVEVVTGPLRFTMSRREFGLFEGVWIDADHDGQFAASERLIGPGGAGGLAVVDDSGALWQAALHEPLIVVERSGPVEAVVRAQGWHASPPGRGHLAYTVRIHAYAGKPYVKVEHTFANLDLARTTQLRSLYLRVPLEEVRSYRTPETGRRALREPARFLQVRDGLDMAWHLAEGTETVARGERMSGVFVLGGESGALGVYVPYFAETHPKAVQVDASGVTLGLWPGQGTKMLSLTRGVAKNHEIYFTFGRDADSVDTAELRAMADGVRPFAQPNWLVLAGSDGGAVSARPSRYPVYEALVGRYFAVSAAAVRVRTPEGVFDHGDVLSASGFWRNNETARPRAYFLQYLRTGDRDAFEIGKLAVQHLMDVDTDHVSGGQYTHNIHHAMGRPGSSHNYPNMSAIYYLVTGSRDALQSARRNGDALIAWSRRTLSGRSLGWTMWGLADLWDLTREQRFRYWALEHARRLEESVETTDGKRVSLSRGGFLYGGTCLNGLLRLHEGTGDEAVKELFLDELKAIMKDAVAANDVRFTGRNCMMFAPLAYAYDLTKDRKYLDWGMAGLYGQLPFESAPVFDFVLAAGLLARADAAGIPEPIRQLPHTWGFKRDHTMYALDEDDRAFTITVFKGGGKEGSWIKVYAPDGTLTASKVYPGAEQQLDSVRIPKDGQRGAYKVELSQAYPTTVNLALSLPKAVLQVDRSMFRLASAPETHYFFVPEKTERFRIGIVQQYGRGENAVAVYDPTGKLVRRHAWLDMPEREWQYIDVAPAEEQRGKLWSITIAVSGQFELELDGVPPYVSLRPDSHFVP